MSNSKSTRTQVVMNREHDKAAQCGEPSYVWRAGQERRLQMILAAAGDRARGVVLDAGCGIGTYLRRLALLANQAYGLEYDEARAREAGMAHPEVVCGASEHLPFPAQSFDLILSHEVLEHVQDDRKAMAEMLRILRPPNRATHQLGGRLILFMPNRGYPFETHGIYWRGRYRFGNIPLVNYLPRAWRDQLAPHVRIYSQKDLRRLLSKLPLRIVHQTVIFGAYDNIIARWPVIGRAIRVILHTLERTPLRIFGLSHFLVLERVESSF